MDLDSFSTIEQMAEALRRRSVSSAELTRAHIRRIHEWNDTLHAYCVVDEDAAMAQAIGCDALRGDRASVLPLSGIPLAVKDIFDQAGHATHSGSNALDDRLPTHSATVVQKLCGAGMIPLGRTHMVEFAFGGWGTNPVQGAPCNPWGIEQRLVAGGSSSGSAVAVAAGLAPAALGTDTGGSIRTPASWCGIVGLKTSHSLVSRAGVVPLCPTHDSVGPLARSVRDVALLLQAMIGPDADDPSTFYVPTIEPLATIEQGVKGLRMGRLRESDLVEVEPETRALYEHAVADFARLGAEIREITLPLTISDYLASGGDIMSVESYALLGHYVEKPGSSIDPVIAARIRRGADISAPSYYRTLETRRQAQRAFAAMSVDFDSFLTPGSHRTPVPLAEVDENEPPNRYGRLINYLDLASLAIPVGLTSAGLPVGLQVVVKRFDDALALRIGRTLERERGGLFVPPPGL